MSTSPIIAPVEETAPASEAAPRQRPSWEEITAWCVIAGGLLFVLFRHLVGGLVGGLALFLILDRLSERFQRRMSGSAARPLALLLVTVIIGGGAVGGVTLAVSFARHHANNIPAMMTKMAEILQSSRAWLGGVGEDLIPEVLTDAENIKETIVAWLKEHATFLRTAGGSFSVGLVHLLMGLLVAILVFFRHLSHRDGPHGPLAEALTQKIQRFADAFARIAMAQIKISAVNTALTAIYILVILPLFGKQIPFGGTIVVVTFMCGLIPVIGNLISNTVITILSLGISVGTAIASLVFLILIHKLEYLINSRIVGGETDSQAWEILLAIVIGETAFGVGGVVMAPIVYAFLKRELRDRGLV